MLKLPNRSFGPGCISSDAASVLAAWSTTRSWLPTAALAWPRLRQPSTAALAASRITPVAAGLPMAKSAGSTVPVASGAIRVCEKAKSGPGCTVTMICRIVPGASSGAMFAASRPSTETVITGE